MTVIAAVVGDDSRVVMGIDSTSIGETGQIETNLMKRLARHTVKNDVGATLGEIAIGAAGIHRLTDEIGFGWIAPTRDAAQDPDVYAWTVARSLQTYMTDPTRWDMLRHEDSRSVDGYFLLAGFGRVWSIAGDFGVSRDARPYMTIGSGGGFAAGAIRTALTLGVDPHEALLLGLEAAADHCAGVNPPFEIVSLHPGGTQ